MEVTLEEMLNRGASQVSVDTITRAAGMAKGNFYRYFSDKRELVDALIHPVAVEVRRAFRRAAVRLAYAKGESELQTAYSLLAAELISVALKNLDIVRFYLQEHRSPATPETIGLHELSQQLDEGAIRISEVALERRLLSVADVRVTALAMVGAAEHLALAYLSGRVPLDPIPSAAIVVQMVLSGIRGNK